MPEFRILLRDMLTGREAWVVEQVEDKYADSHAFLWQDGNFACDCNRLQLLTHALGVPEEDAVCGVDRVAIVDATQDGRRLDSWAEI